jgi:hypothetical protein
MASITTYGDFPGVRVQTAGGAITGVAVGREQKLVLIGDGDPSNGSASTNEPVGINSRIDADNKFGSGTELANNIRDALNNGARRSLLSGVMVDETTVTEEDITDGGDATDSSTGSTIDDAPIVEDTSVITVEDDTDTVLDVEFRYGQTAADLSTPGADTIYINPITGAWKADESDNYDITYDYPDYSSALDAAKTDINEEETGIIAPIFESEDVASELSTAVNELRPNYKMAVGLHALEPNQTNTDNEASYDTSEVTHGLDNDAVFLYAPARKDGDDELITGALGGIMAGNELNDSIYYDEIEINADLNQRLSGTEESDLEDERVMAIRQSQSGGTIRVARNLSTSTSDDWERDYWRRRIVDQVILLAKTIGDSILGDINDVNTRDTVESSIRSELKGLADDRLIEAGGQGGYFVDVYEVNDDTVGIDLGITPRGIAKNVEVSITIDT